MIQRMSTVPEIERAIELLPAEDLSRFRAWFAEYDAAHWDGQIKRDAGAGRLDALGEQALVDLRQERCTDL